MKRTLQLLLLISAAGAAGWFAAERRGDHPGGSPNPAAAPAAGRRVKFYQSPMHPWITSDKPGKCTVCGMKLVPVYDGDAGFTSDRPGLVTLGTNAVRVMGITTTPVRVQPLVRTLRVSGTVEDDDSRHRFLSAYIDGRIESLHVAAVGVDVTAGQPLARFFSPRLNQVVLEYLYAAIPPAGVPAPNPAARDGAALRLRQMGLTTEQIEQLPRTFNPTNQTIELVSPMTGTVVLRRAYPGQYVKEGDPLFEIGDFSRMWFQFVAYERDLPWLRVGQLVTVTTPAQPGRSFTNAIVFVDPNVDATTRTARVRVEIPNVPDGHHGLNHGPLLHRLYGEGRVALDAPEVLAVPRVAVLNADGLPAVFVDLGSGYHERRRVHLGRAGDDLYEVLDGLREGERVVVNGGLLLDSAAQVNHAAAP